MKRILQILIVICIPVFIWSCEKEVKIKYNRIEGTLSAGMDMSQNDLDSVPVVMVKIYDSLDFASVTLSPQNFENFYAANADAGGYYYFDSLPDGHYLVATGEGYKFADVDFEKVTASNGSVKQVNKTVNRAPLKNGPDTYSVEITNSSPYKISRLEFFVNGTSLGLVPLTLEQNYGREWSRREEVFDIVLDGDQNPYFQVELENNGRIILTPMIPFFHSIFEYYNFYLFMMDRLYKTLVKPTDVYFKKAWFFGHFIQIYWVKPEIEKAQG
jgi:hypothetical protein